MLSAEESEDMQFAARRVGKPSADPVENEMRVLSRVERLSNWSAMQQASKSVVFLLLIFLIFVISLCRIGGEATQGRVIKDWSRECDICTEDK